MTEKIRAAGGSDLLVNFYDYLMSDTYHASMATHYTEDLYAAADRLLILERGRAAYYGNPG